MGLNSYNYTIKRHETILFLANFFQHFLHIYLISIYITVSDHQHVRSLVRKGQSFARL